MAPRSLIDGQLPAGCAIACCDPRDLPPEATLWPTEEAAVARAVPKRRQEFAAGRLAARRCFAQLGLPPLPIPMGSDRAPLWPPSVTGSISHVSGYCVAVAAWTTDVRSIGVDAEDGGPLDRDLWELVMTRDERSWVESLAREFQGRAAKLIFSAKESVYKCQHQLTSHFLDFQQVAVVIEQSQSFAAGRFTATIPHARCPVVLGNWATDAARVETVAWVP